MNYKHKIIKTVSIYVVALLIHFSCFGQDQLPGLLNKLQKSTNDSESARCYSNISNYYMYSNVDSAYYYLNKGLKKFTESNYQYGIASMTKYLGILDASHGNLEMAKKREQEALGIFKELKDQKNIGITLNELGSIEGRKGNYDVATDFFISALKVNTDASDDDGKVVSYTNLGMINGFTNNFDVSLDYYNKALALVKDTNQVRTICDLNINIGTVYGRKGEFKKAGEYIERAKEKSNKTELVDVYIYALLNLGIVYQNLNDNKTATEYLNEALQLTRQKNMPSEETQVTINLATLTMKSDPKKSIALLDGALVIAKKLNSKSLLADIYFNLVEVNKGLGNYKAVTELLEEEMNVTDSLYTIEKAKEIANLQAVYELEQSNSKIKQLNLSMQQQQLRKDIMIVIVLSLIVIVVFIGIYLTKKRQLYKIVYQQKEELLKSNTIKDKLFSIIGHDLRGPLGNIYMVMELLESETDKQERQKTLDMLKTQTQYAINTLDTLLIWGNSHLNNNKAKPALIDVTEYINRSLQLLNIAAKQKNISFVNNIATGELTEVDPNHFDFIVRNLISNAIKYSYNGGTVEIDLIKDMLPGYKVFSITDHGVGIGAEQMAKIFEAIGKSTNGTVGEKGTGLGLMLCKEFAIANGGDVWVESSAGKGARFYFSFKSV